MANLLLLLLVQAGVLRFSFSRQQSSPNACIPPQSIRLLSSRRPRGPKSTMPSFVTKRPNAKSRWASAQKAMSITRTRRLVLIHLRTTTTPSAELPTEPDTKERGTLVVNIPRDGSHGIIFGDLTTSTKSWTAPAERSAKTQKCWSRWCLWVSRSCGRR